MKVSLFSGVKKGEAYRSDARMKALRTEVCNREIKKMFSHSRSNIIHSAALLPQGENSYLLLIISLFFSLPSSFRIMLALHDCFCKAKLKYGFPHLS